MTELFLAMQLAIIVYALLHVRSSEKTTPGRVGYLIVGVCFCAWLLSKAVGMLAADAPLVLAIIASFEFAWVFAFAALGLHAAMLALRAAELAQGRYWVAQSNMLLCVLISLSGAQGALSESAGVFGFALQVYLLVSLLAFSTYAVLYIGKSYRSQADAFLQFRARWFVSTAAKVCFALMLISLATPSMAAATMSELLGVGVFVVGAHAVADGPRIYLEHRIQQLLQHPNMDDEAAMLQLQSLIQTLSLSLEQDAATVLRIPMTSNGAVLGQAKSEVTLSSRIHAETPEDLTGDEYAQTLPQGWVDGMQTSIAELNENNRRMKERLSFLAQELEAHSDTSLKTALEPFTDTEQQSTPEPHDPAVLGLLEHFHCTVIQGCTQAAAIEKVRKLHTALSDSTLVEASCTGIDSATLQSQLDHLLSHPQDRTGLALYHIEHLHAEQLLRIGSAVEQIRTHAKLLYLHGEPSMLLEQLPLDYYDYYPLRRLVFNPHTKSSPRPSTAQVNTQALRAMLLHFLRHHHYSLESTAEDLNMSPQTLSRLRHFLDIPRIPVVERGVVIG